jgi:hypothetical protein
VKEQFASKLRGVLIEDDDEESDFDDDEDGANASSSFPLDSTRTSMLAMALMYQDLKARSTRRAEELRGENGDEKEESSRDDYSPHWQAYVDLLPTNVDSLLLWSTEELAFLQNSRIGERAKRRKKLVAEEFQVLFSNASLREEFERLMMPQTKQTQTQTRQRKRLTPFRFETLREWFEWAYATVLARAFTLPEIENGALLLCPGLDIFNSARDAAKCEVRLSPHDDISLHATVGGYRAGTQAFHDYADKSSGGALLEFGFIYDDDERLNFPLFMDDDDEKEKAKESTTFIYEGATEIEISATCRVARLLGAPARSRKMQTARRPRPVLDDRKTRPPQIPPLQRHRNAVGLLRGNKNPPSFLPMRLERFTRHRPNDRTRMYNDDKNPNDDHHRVIFVATNIQTRIRSILGDVHRGRFDRVTANTTTPKSRRDQGTSWRQKPKTTKPKKSPRRFETSSERKNLAPSVLERHRVRRVVKV